MAQCRTYCGAELRVFWNVEPYTVQFCHGRENVVALWQQCEVAYEYEVVDAGSLSCEYGCTAYRLQHEVYQSLCNVLLRCVALRLSEERGRCLFFSHKKDCFF